MPVEIAIILLIVAVFFTVRITLAYLQKQGEKSEAWHWANYRTPLIYEQADHTDRAAMQALEQYENALAKLREHGNLFLSTSDVHRWIWKTDTNTKTDFEAWKFENVTRRVRVFEDFFRQKAENARKNGNDAAAARFFAMSESAADFVKNENGEL